MYNPRKVPKILVLKTIFSLAQAEVRLEVLRLTLKKKILIVAKHHAQEAKLATQTAAKDKDEARHSYY